MVPTWVAVLTGIGGLLVSALITPFVTLRVAQRGDVTVRRGQDLTKSQSDRDLITTAAELARSADAFSRRQGLALLDGLSKMSELSQDDAVLVMSLMRPRTEPALSESRGALQQGGTVEFQVDMGRSKGEGDSEGSADDDDPGE